MEVTVSTILSLTPVLQGGFLRVWVRQNDVDCHRVDRPLLPSYLVNTEANDWGPDIERDYLRQEVGHDTLHFK